MLTLRCRAQHWWKTPFRVQKSESERPRARNFPSSQPRSASEPSSRYQEAAVPSKYPRRHICGDGSCRYCGDRLWRCSWKEARKYGDVQALSLRGHRNCHGNHLLCHDCSPLQVLWVHRHGDTYCRHCSPHCWARAIPVSVNEWKRGRLWFGSGLGIELRGDRSGMIDGWHRTAFGTRMFAFLYNACIIFPWTQATKPCEYFCYLKGIGSFGVRLQLPGDVRTAARTEESEWMNIGSNERARKWLR